MNPLRRRRKVTGVSEESKAPKRTDRESEGESESRQVIKNGAGEGTKAGDEQILPCVGRQGVCPQQGSRNSECCGGTGLTGCSVTR